MHIPEPENSVAALVDRAHEDARQPPRPHMGASLLGHPCDRWLWLGFRWAVVEKTGGRTLRLFRRGSLEEATVVQDLRAIGVAVSNAGASQSRVDFGSHVSGSCDGVVAGVPGASKATAVLEIKTHGDKSFKDVVANGVQKSKPGHWVQMQIYMWGLNLNHALYYAVNKNDDRIYTELLYLDKVVAEKAIARGKRIALDNRMPPPLSTDPSWYECRWCAASDFCHSSKTTKEVNCRTCAHSTALENSTWLCENYSVEIPKEAQRDGCKAHILHPDLVPWKYKTFEHGVVWMTPWGDIQNGEGDANIYESTEILANPKACANGMASDLRDTFDARIIPDKDEA